MSKLPCPAKSIGLDLVPDSGKAVGKAIVSLPQRSVCEGVSAAAGKARAVAPNGAPASMAGWSEHM